MGRPKALLPWRGATLLETVTEVLGAVTDRVLVVTSGDFPLPDLASGIEVVRDREPHLGPLGGIRDGLHAAGAGLAFVASTDAPWLARPTVEAMLAWGSAAALEMDGHVQTLCAVYDASRAGDADRLIDAGRMRPLHLLEASGYRSVSPDEVPEPESIRGFNRPGDYLDAVRKSGVEGGAVVELFGRARRRLGRESIEVPVGTLAEVLAIADPEGGILRDGEIHRDCRVSLNARDFVRDVAIPIGPGDHVIVIDAAAGG